MAERGLLPTPLTRVLPRRRTPGVAIVVTTLVAIVLAVTGELVDLASTVVLLLLFVFLSTNTAVLVLRKDRLDHDHFHSPTVIPVLAIVSCLVLLTRQEPQHWGLAGILLAAGVLIYATTRRFSRASPETAKQGQVEANGPARPLVGPVPAGLRWHPDRPPRADDHA